MPKRSESTYEVRSTLHAPLPFAFAWCTDYSPDDARLEKESYTRRIIERSKRRVVYEDLEDSPPGWAWSRHTVTLRPPNAWHSDSVGNHRTWSLDYTLTARPDGSTELHLRGTRRPTEIGGANPPRAKMERDILYGWRQFDRALTADYRRSLRSRRRSG